jgi:D-alanine-D-alanine ligase
MEKIMRIAVLHNAVTQQDAIEDQDVLVQVDVVSQSLERLGHEHFAVPCNLDLDAMKNELRKLRPDMVFNLVEALDGDDSLVYLPPAVLNALRLPYTGASAESLFLTTHKLLAKDRLSRAGMRTPSWIVQDTIGEIEKTPDITSPSPHPGPFPKGEGSLSRWIIKGVWEQGSRDMDDDAVFTGNVPEVHRRLQERVKRTTRPAFAEEYIEGREFNLAILTAPGGAEILPPAEIDFSSFPPEKPRIVGYRAKWQADSFEYNNTPRRCDFSAADRPLLDSLADLALQCWQLFMLRGWGRVDFRVDQSGRPWILEVNANPCLSPDAGFAAALRRAGIEIDEAIRRIVDEVKETVPFSLTRKLGQSPDCNSCNEIIHPSSDNTSGIS